MKYAKLLRIARIWLPLGIAAAGVVLIVIGQARVRGGGQVLDDSTAAMGVALIIVAMIVWLINWMFRMSVQSNRDREREEEARRHFETHGVWPDE